AAFLDLLARHDVDVYALARDVTVDNRTYKAGQSYIIPTRQSQYTMIRGLFDRVVDFEENVFYDVSGWTMPLAYDLDYSDLDGVRFNNSLLGKPATSLDLKKPAPAASDYGYIFDWDDYYAPRALYRFLKNGAYARVLMRPKDIAAGGVRRTYDRGAIFVPVSGQEISAERLSQIAVTAAADDFVDIRGVDSGNAAAGVGDLGSRGSVRSIKKPSVLLLFDDGVARYSAGQLWHLLDHKMNIPVVLRRKGTIGDIDLGDYSHIILPDGGRARLSDDDADAVDAWIRNGGVFIATKRAAAWAQTAFLKEAIAGNDGDQNGKKNGDAGAPDRFNYEDKTIRDAKHVVAGSLFASDLDVTHPLAFGHRDRDVASMKASPQTLKTPRDPVATVAVYKEAPLLSGYASEKRLEEIAGTPMLTANRHGAGSIVLFADDPAFRATFPGTEKLFLNALFFAPVVDRAAIVEE
ncbi:MAG: peptidase, partial [Pseudomonadota bacterium]